MAPFNYGSKSLHLNSTLLLFDHFVLEINDSADVTEGDKTHWSDRLIASRSHEGNIINTGRAFLGFYKVKKFYYFLSVSWTPILCADYFWSPHLGVVDSGGV